MHMLLLSTRMHVCMYVYISTIVAIEKRGKENKKNENRVNEANV